MFPPTTTRVRDNTSKEINDKIHHQIEENIARYAHASRFLIDQRLAQLDREWDIERLLEANAAFVSLLGVILGTTVHILFLMIPGIVATFLLIHAIWGWCPPVPFFRWMGIRTPSEIDHERYALKTIRGDFAHLPHSQAAPEESARELLKAVEA
jgi:hypothetical protein